MNYVFAFYLDMHELLGFFIRSIGVPTTTSFLFSLNKERKKDSCTRISILNSNQKRGWAAGAPIISISLSYRENSKEQMLSVPICYAGAPINNLWTVTLASCLLVDA
jgi:hypothetical protein